MVAETKAINQNNHTWLSTQPPPRTLVMTERKSGVVKRKFFDFWCLVEPAMLLATTIDIISVRECKRKGQEPRTWEPLTENSHLACGVLLSTPGKVGCSLLSGLYTGSGNWRVGLEEPSTRGLRPIVSKRRSRQTLWHEKQRELSEPSNVRPIV